MSYCTIDDIRNQVEEARLVQLTDDEGMGAVAAARVSRAIGDADEEINSYLGVRMSVPLDPVPESVRRLSVDIALYNLYARREKIPENRSERYRNAVRILESAAMGRISLGQSDPDGNPLDPNRPEAAGDNPVRSFTRSTLSGF
ncbi:MAG: gp436 family protein [Syntrophobacteraceae bacterium]